MTLPLVVLAMFAIAAGWVGIPEHFPGLGGLLPNWFHEFVGSTLAEAPQALGFSAWPLLTSLVVALGGLTLGWIVYRNVRQGQPDPIQNAMPVVHKLLQNKYYIDEAYNVAFVRPAYWISETFTYLFLDRTVIDGFLHIVARIASSLGTYFRNYIDRPVVNGFGDFVGEGTKWLGRRLRFIQTGLVQQYLIIALVFAFGTLFVFLYTMMR